MRCRLGHGSARPPSRSRPPASVKRKRTARASGGGAGLLAKTPVVRDRSRTGRRAPGRSRPGAREVLARGADRGDRLVLERAGRRAGRAARSRGRRAAARWGSARPRRRAAGRPRAPSTTNRPPVAVFLQHVAQQDVASARPRRCPQLERAVEHGRLQRRQQQPALALVALLPLAAQQGEAARGVVAVGAEPLLAVAVGDAVARRAPRSARAAPRPRRRSRRRSAPTSKRLPRRCPRRSLLPVAAPPRARGRRPAAQRQRALGVEAGHAQPLARRGVLVLHPRVADVARGDAERRASRAMASNVVSPRFSIQRNVCVALAATARRRGSPRRRTDRATA